MAIETNLRARLRWRARIELGDTAQAVALASHLARLGWHGVECDGGSVVGELSSAMTVRDGLAEVSLYLSLWHPARPDIRSVSLTARSLERLRDG